MSFFWLHAFWLLLFPAGMVALDLTRRRRSAQATRPKILRAEADAHRLMLTTEPGSVRNGRVRWRLALGLVLLVLALARPQWGRIEEPVFDQSREILIAVDLSRSMLAEDVKPSRLARAKLLITSLLERLAGERVGLVVFAGTSFLQSPLSADYEILREFLPALDPGYLPEGGTDYKALLETALTAFAPTAVADRYLIILSDGEAQTDDWQQVVPELEKQGVRVISLGIGTAAGAMIPDGEGSFVKDERGAVVMTRLNSATLQDLARRTDGVYTDASGWVDLAQVLRETVEAGRKGEFRETSRVRLAERFQWALAPAVLLLLWSYWREFPVHPRARTVKLTPAAQRVTASTPVAAPLAVLAFASLVLPDFSRAAEPNPEADALSAPLSALVGQLSARDHLGARDYADLARTTLTYGQRVRDTGQPVPAGPVRDGLAAVTAGEALDATAADWNHLHRELEALLEQPEPPPQEQPPPEQSDDQEKQKSEGEQGQDGEQSDDGSPNEDSSDQSGQEQSPGEPGKEGESETPPPQAGQSAFGEMDSEPPPPPPPANPGENQKFGGQPDRPYEAAQNPELAIPLQKLEQLRNQDAPARLYQLMQDPKGEPATKGRDW